jgi:MraZ protein
MFIGISEHSLDNKNRVFVPKRIQDFLTRGSNGALVAYLTAGQDGCVYLFSEAGFQVALAELNTGVFEGADQRAAQRLFFANAARLELDASGRLLIPEMLRKRARLEKEVVMVGVQNRSEIWSREVWEKFSEENDRVLEEIDTVMRKPAPASKSSN